MALDAMGSDCTIVIIRTRQATNIQKGRARLLQMNRDGVVLLRIG